MISLCIPTYNRVKLVLESFSKVIENDIITEIIIVDDNSENSIFEKLEKEINELKNNKIKLFRNTENKKAFLNKLECVRISENDWIILLDSDNILTQDYIDSIPKELDKKTFYLPSHAVCDSPFLNYDKFSNKSINKLEYKTLSQTGDSNDQLKFATMLNTGNYLVNKYTYIESIAKEEDILEPYALDPFYQIFLGFKNIDNFKLKVVDNMNYYHRLHTNSDESGSYYSQNSKKSDNLLIYLKSKIIEI
jgi:glycosyltransferase involved in cell wall biosynthesis